MKRILIAAAMAALATSAAYANGDAENGAVALLVTDAFCEGVTVPDNILNETIMLASAEMGTLDLEKTATYLTYRAVVSASILEKNGGLPKFCNSMKSFLKSKR